MIEALLIIGALAIWIVLQMIVLPRFGVPT